jgi:CubicO group peptidase (beta-lactamase class C family)
LNEAPALKFFCASSSTCISRSAQPTITMRWKGGRVVSETWINAATAPQIKTIYRGLDYGFQFWLGASFVPGKRIDWVEAQGQGGQRIFIVPTLDLVTVVTAGNYYGNDRLANLVPQIVLDDYVLPAVDPAR